jgi:hypothetical protein
MKRQVVPGALRTLRLRPGRKYCRLGDLASQVGWKHDALITKLEGKRKEKSSLYYKQKLVLAGLRRRAEANVASKLTDVNAKLQELGHTLKPRQTTTAPAAAAGGKKAAAAGGKKAAAGGKKKAAAAAEEEED